MILIQNLRLLNLILRLCICRFTFLNYDEIMQFTLFAGLEGINFMLAWWGTVGSDLISYRNSKPSTSMIDNRSSTEDNNSDTILKMPPTHPLNIC